MKRYGRKNKTILSQCLLRGLLIASAIPGVLSTALLCRQMQFSPESLKEDTAVFSALYTVPDRARHQLNSLDQRFSQKVEDFPQESTQENFSAENQLPKVDSDPAPTPKEEFMPLIKSVPKELPEIPPEYTGKIIEEDFSVSPKNHALTFGQGVIKNSTSFSDAEAKKYLEAENPVRLDHNGPQVLIMHTHATESFEPYDTDTYDTRHTWRSTDNQKNIVLAGEVLADQIRSYGIEVLHDDTQHDYPSYNGSYERSAVTVKNYLKKYPSIKVVLDIHRDAIQRGNTLVKPIITVNGKKAAQLMIIAGCDDGTMGMPNWGKNFRFAAGMQDAIQRGCPGLCRPVFFCHRKYNQDLTTGSLLIEMGSHGNTLDEVLYTAQLAGNCIGEYLSLLQKN